MRERKGERERERSFNKFTLNFNVIKSLVLRRSWNFILMVSIETKKIHAVNKKKIFFHTLCGKKIKLRFIKPGIDQIK